MKTMRDSRRVGVYTERVMRDVSGDQWSVMRDVPSSLRQGMSPQTTAFALCWHLSNDSRHSPQPRMHKLMLLPIQITVSVDQLTWQ